MSIGDKVYENSFFVEPDPNFDFELSEYLEQEELLLLIEKNIRNLNLAVSKARNIKLQFENQIKKMADTKEFSDLIKMGEDLSLIHI